MEKVFIAKAVVDGSEREVTMTEEMASDVYGMYQKDVHEGFLRDAADELVETGEITEAQRAELDNPDVLGAVLNNFDEMMCDDICHVLEIARCAVEDWFGNAKE